MKTNEKASPEERRAKQEAALLEFLLGSIANFVICKEMTNVHGALSLNDIWNPLHKVSGKQKPQYKIHILLLAMLMNFTKLCRSDFKISLKPSEILSTIPLSQLMKEICKWSQRKETCFKKRYLASWLLSYQQVLTAGKHHLQWSGALTKNILNWFYTHWDANRCPEHFYFIWVWWSIQEFR